MSEPCGDPVVDTLRALGHSQRTSKQPDEWEASLVASLAENDVDPEDVDSVVKRAYALLQIYLEPVGRLLAKWNIVGMETSSELMDALEMMRKSCENYMVGLEAQIDFILECIEAKKVSNLQDSEIPPITFTPHVAVKHFTFLTLHDTNDTYPPARLHFPSFPLLWMITEAHVPLNLLLVLQVVSNKLITFVMPFTSCTSMA
ncbi:hypothetical protein Pelo_14285 [Pelomyxa schiedti]|nr:hypothetical protein Pelo_14285 [Pelomyxa schiedti]